MQSAEPTHEITFLNQNLTSAFGSVAFVEAEQLFA